MGNYARKRAPDDPLSQNRDLSCPEARAYFNAYGVEEGFLRPEHRAMILVDDEPERLLDRMAAYESPTVPKWISGEER